MFDSFDPPTCDVLKTLAPVVDGLPTAGVFSIDPATGDTYVGGTGPAYLFQDCPPYADNRPSGPADTEFSATYP